MTINELLAEIGARRIQLRRSGDELVLRGSQQTLDPALVGELRTHKPALLAMMSEDTEQPGPPSAAGEPEASATPTDNPTPGDPAAHDAPTAPLGQAAAAPASCTPRPRTRATASVVSQTANGEVMRRA